MSVHFSAAGNQLQYTGGAPVKTAITVSYWVHRTTNTNTTTTHFRVRDSSDVTVWSMGSSSSGNFPAIGSVTGGTVFDLSQSYADNCWTWIAVTVSGTSGTIYYQVAPGDPVYTYAATVDGGGTAAKYSLGGRGSDNNENFIGHMAAVKVWDGVLAARELLAERSQVLPVRTAGLYAAYPLDSAAVAGRLDHSGRGRMLGTLGTVTTIPDGPPIPRQRIIVRPWLSSPAGAGSVTGTVAAALGALTATISGTVEVSGTVAAPLGALTATAVQQTPEVTGTVAAPLGALTASLSGTVEVSGTVTAPLGGLTATASGTVDVPGVVTSALGGLVATVVGTRATTGTVAAPLGALTATVVVPANTTGRYTIGTPTRNARDQLGTPTRTGRYTIGTPS